METDLERYYYGSFAWAYLRGSLPKETEIDRNNMLQIAAQNGLSIHRFKRTIELPRVRKVLGMQQSFYPQKLLDIGSGRGVFLWPLLETFPDLSVTAVDLLLHRITMLEAVQRGGMERLHPIQADVTALTFADQSFDVVTMLEVLEHLPRPQEGAKQVLRVCQQSVIISVPSKLDENPEHLRLYTPETLREVFQAAAEELNVRITLRSEYVLNHILAGIKVIR